MNTRGHHGLLLASSGAAPTFPVYLSSTTTVFAAAATSHLVNMPATVNAGDLLIIQFGVPQNAAPTTPAGWNVLGGVSSGAVFRGQWYYKLAAGTEGGTTVDVVTASQKAAAVVHRIQAGTFDPATPPEIATGTLANTTTPDPTSLSPSWGADDTLWLAVFCGRNGGTVSAYPFIDGNIAASSGSTGNTDAIVASCWVQQNTATQNPGTFTRSVAANQVVPATIGIRPI